MRANTLLAAVVGCATFAAAVPFRFSPNGFPNISRPSSDLTQIQFAAHGSLPTVTPPKSVSSNSLTSLRLIAFNELAEVAFFTELINNITTNVYPISTDARKVVIVEALTAILAQEKLHALNANAAISHFGADPVKPCAYNFPVQSFQEAITLAATFTDLVLGTLQDVATLFGADGDAALIRGVASVIGQEGEQEGFFRTAVNKIPSALPFLTTSTREFAFSVLNQGFVVAGSCPNVHDIALPVFDPLVVETATIAAKAQNLQFSIALPNGRAPSLWATRFGDHYEKLSIVYINQQNTPVYEKPISVTVEEGKVVFEAAFPFNGTTFGNGLTIAVLSTGTGASSADEVADTTAFGPGLIEIN